MTGKIPWQLSTLEFLSTLNLSTNNLSGEIPQGRHFDTFTKDSFLGNLALCGAPVTKKCKDDELPPREADDDVDYIWFDWKMILIGYGIGPSSTGTSSTRYFAVLAQLNCLQP
ncbi:hypothetical protein ACET3Z_012819 [Daucus carota]